MNRRYFVGIAIVVFMPVLLAQEPKGTPAFPVPAMTEKRKDVKPFEYVDVGTKIPNYTPGRTWGVQGEPFRRMQKPLPAEESLKHFVVPQGFRVELFACDPQIGKPLCMNWDERGRLWIAETVDYPNELQPRGKGRDRIRICEDADGDGRADKFTVFAEQLSIPTSLMFSRGGLIVFDGTQTVFLKDTDGDDRADVREVMFGTWSQRDTHGGPSNMQYGLDNWIWGMQGYNLSRLKVGGESHEFRQGFFRFKPDGSKLEFIRSTDNNTWGLGISEEGIIFGSTANRNPSVYMPIANRYYERVRGWAPSLVLQPSADTHLFRAVTDKVRQVDHHGGYTAGAGHALYTARRYPREYWNRTAFVTEPTGHLVGTFVLRSEGSHFRSSNLFNLAASHDEWTAPIMAEVGPDGNVWIIDWYNYIVQHNPTPQGFQTGKGAAYESDLRDKKHGRIYRIVYGDDVPAAERPTLAGSSPEKLVAMLGHDNLFWRRHAQRLLVERGQLDVLAQLLEAAGKSGVDEIGLNVGVIHALWTLHGLSALDGSQPAAIDASLRALRHASAGVRRNALQVLPPSQQSLDAILQAGLLSDPDAQVRLAAFLALADQPASPAAGAALAAALQRDVNLKDRWIPDAATAAAARHSTHFLLALPVFKQSTDRLAALTATVAEHHARTGKDDSVGVIVQRLVESDTRLAEAVVQGFRRGWPKDQPPRLNAELEESLDKLAKKLSPERRAMLVQLAVAWGSAKFEKYAAEVAGALLARVTDESLAAEDRTAAARELAAYRSSDVETVKTLLAVVTPRTPPELAAGLLRALQSSTAGEVGPLIVEQLPALTPTVRSTGISVLLSRPIWTRTLLEAIDQGRLGVADLSLDQRQALAEHPEAGLRRRALEVLRRGGALPSPDRQKVLDELLPLAKAKGDAEAGKVVFKNQCGKCHVHGGEGFHIGPDLTGMAVHPKEELLMNIIDPSRSVEGNYRVYTVATTTGRVLTGLLASESKTAIELFDVEGKKQTVLREEVDELRASPKSLMPDGFEKQLNAKELTDLLEFLTQRGKYLPLPLDKVATAVSTRGMFNSSDSTVERLVFDDWKPKTFAGVPFHLVDPQDRVPNVILLHGPQGSVPPRMPKSVVLPCGSSAKSIHLLTGISGWGFPLGEKGSVSVIVRLHYEDGKTEEHELRNGEHFADYIRRIDVPGSQFAFNLRGRQVRYLAIHPRRDAAMKQIEFAKGLDDTAPIIVAVTLEGPE